MDLEFELREDLCHPGVGRQVVTQPVVEHRTHPANLLIAASILQLPCGCHLPAVQFDLLPEFDKSVVLKSGAQQHRRRPRG